MSSYFSQFFTGISLGAILLLIALGLTFTFGQMNVINMAHGELIMAGAYTVFMLQGPLGETGSLLIALPVAFVVAGAHRARAGGRRSYDGCTDARSTRCW